MFISELCEKTAGPNVSLDKLPDPRRPMCGIAGIFSYRDSAPRVDPAEVIAIRDAMSARGPDGAGQWMSADERVGLAHRRLAIVDLSEAGAQPMATVDGSLHITFNGEI